MPTTKTTIRSQVLDGTSEDTGESFPLDISSFTGNQHRQDKRGSLCAFVIAMICRTVVAGSVR